MGSRVTSGVLSGALLVLSAITAWGGECQPDVLEWRGGGGSARFNVEIADTSEARSRGLMYRESLPRSAGMLFVYPEPQHASFWMRNTLIPLDMIFADATGRVTVVHSNAVPGDETPIDGGEGVQFVLEINGGLAARMGIVPGGELRHPSIDQALAAWPCAE
ncbi:DUF192 domain-containing protein [Tabrizicola sp. J26]|uniref:DUF192 domain-containing protein n=1 Tax=Alitabrizicola rongguiensis TaxID=2909234 RepID=UPI001F1C26EC|nr:DUF192 domain-containing protein [Tabrizicola rongguiensis]MCF1708661.1 DUF192 domain-containing protein [Tabrizicola rongguiensis]